jgi:hypothetical protein
MAGNYRRAFKAGTLGTPKPTNLKPLPTNPKPEKVEAPKPKLVTVEPESPSEPLELEAPTPVVEEIVGPSEERTEAPSHGSRLTKGMVWSAFVLGIGMSVVANVAASWHAGLMGRVAAATAPLAFMFAVEIIQRVNWPRGFVWWLARYGGTGSVAAVAAVTSYLHQLRLLQGFEHSELIPYILPVAIDGLIVVSSAALIAMSKER